MPIKLIVGLRNPGAKYESTRHNAGGWFAQSLVMHQRQSFKIEPKLHAELSVLEYPDGLCKIMMPTTFMNQSGLAVRAVCQFYKIQIEEILVAHDELDLPTGRVRLKTGGGHGGHNGLRDLIQQLGSNAFHRLRIGIGHPGHKELVLNYVLGKPSLSDQQLIQQAIDRSIDCMPLIISDQLARAMNVLNV